MANGPYPGGNAYRQPDPGVRPLGDGMLRRQQNAQQMGLPKPACGIPFRTLQSGVSFIPDKKQATVTQEPYPFRCSIVEQGETTITVRVYPGTVSGVMPKISGVDLDAGTPPSLTISKSGTHYVMMTVSATLDATEQGYVLSTASIEVEISVVSSIPADDKSGTYYRRIATFVDGVKTAQVVQNSLDLYMRDDGTGSSQANANFVVSG